MAATRNPIVRLCHIRDEIAALQEALSGTSYDQFEADYLRRRAAEHALLIISEAARTLPAALVAVHPAVDWTNMRAIGNRLRHEYAIIDPVTVWDIVQTDLPVLAEAVADLITRIEDDAGGTRTEA